MTFQPVHVPSRRAMISALGGGIGGIALGGMLQREVVANAEPHFRPRAKRVIQLFMNGGPFQGDFFDPKPMLKKYAGTRPQEVNLRTERRTAGLLASPFRYRRHGENGLPISELLPAAICAAMSRATSGWRL